MEKWQVDWITENLVELQGTTRCTVRLLTALQSRKILDPGEIDELDDEVRTERRVKKFYDILLTRDCYDILTDELANCSQTGAEKILRNGKELQVSNGQGMQRGISEAKKFARGPDGLQDFLNSSDKKVLLIYTMDVKVTMKKIQDNMNMALSVAKNRRHLREKLRENSDPLKLYLFKCGEIPDSEFIAEIVSLSSNGAKAILLAKDNRCSRLETQGAQKTATDTLRWTDLKYWFQEELLEKEVKYQMGWESVKVRTVFEDAGEKDDIQDEQLLMSLANDETPAIFRGLPEAYSYYVERKIRPRYVLNQNVIFNLETSDIFLLTGIESGELSQYLSRCRHSSDNSWSQVNQLSVNYITLEHTDHFEKICELAKQKERSERGKVVGVHWVHHDDGNFIWVKSGNGSMKRIQDATANMTEENERFSESEFISHLDTRAKEYGNSPILIADTPGMGKSTLLQSLARKILEQCSGTKIVLFVTFSDLVNLIKTNLMNDAELRVDTFENTLLQLTTECGPELGKCLLKSISSKSRKEIKMELMFDGYDELNSDDLPLAKKILTLIRNSYHSARIWVATRPHHMHELENQLHVVGFTILPFDESDQENFLVEFWQSEKIKKEDSSNCTNTRPDFLTFARHCLNHVKQIWVKKSEKEDICGVPLRCLLVAKVYLDDCLSFTSRDKRITNSEPRLSLNVISIKDLFEALIQKKLEIYAKKYKKRFRPDMKNKLLNIHYFYALQLLFPKHAPAFEAALTVGSVPMKDILNLGIVESATFELRDNPPKFGHRTIPEFLVARFVAENLREEEGDPVKEVVHQSFANYDVGNLLFDGVIRTVELEQEILKLKFPFHKFENQALVFFLDSLLQGLSLDKPPKLEKIVRGRHLAATTSACVHGDHLNLFKALRNGFEIIDITTLVMAVTQSSILFLQYICTTYNVNLVDCDSVTEHYTLLHVAVESRGFSYVEFLLNCQGFGQLVKDYHPSIQDLINTVVADSNRNPEWRIKEKILILRKLVELNRGLLTYRANIINQKPYTFRQFDHVELTLELLNLGEHPLAKGEDGSTLLHSCCILSGDDFHRVTTKLSEEEVKKLANANIIFDKSSALHKIAQHMRHPKKEALELLLKLGANFAVVNSKGQTCLHVAAICGNKEAARLFLELGMHAVVNLKDEEGETALDRLLMRRIKRQVVLRFGVSGLHVSTTENLPTTQNPLMQFVIVFPNSVTILRSGSLNH